MNINGKVAWITGGVSGIGAASAEALHAEGAKLLLTDINVALGAEFVKKFGDDAIFIKADNRSRTELQAAVDAAVEKWGHLDLLMNSAGQGYSTCLTTTDPDRVAKADADWEDGIKVLLTGSYITAQIAANCFEKNEPDANGERGSIILISSMAADKVYGYFSPEIAAYGIYGFPYGAAKAGILGLVRDLAIIMGPRGVRVNCIKPGYILTPLVGVTEDKQHGEGDKYYLPMQIFPKQGGQPENIATMVVEMFKNPFVNRAAVAVDAGVVG